MSGDSELMEAAAELARLMGEAALRHFRKDVAVEQKPDGSPVTVADREAEHAALEWLARRFPEDAVVGEEHGERAGSSGRSWLLDPIDGTRTFVRGVPLWGSLAAVVEDGRVLAGAAAFPAVGEALAAAPGQGAWHNGVRCAVSPVSRLADAAVMATAPGGFSDPEVEAGWRVLAAAAGLVRTWGDCYGYLLVATGRAEVMVDARLHPWDIACFVPVLAEAGGVLTDLKGRPWPELASGVATNRALAREVRDLLLPA